MIQDRGAKFDSVTEQDKELTDELIVNDCSILVKAGTKNIIIKSTRTKQVMDDM